MPKLSNERWSKASPHLDAALDLPVEQRASFIAALRAEDPALAADVEALLDEHGVLSREGFLVGDSAPQPLQTSLAGLVLGAYTLRSPLGQGGMGTVWLAERNDGRFEGVAAVKLLNASLIGRDGEARFRREGSVLARLRHPHIAHLIDAGVSPMGQPYLVLEHVDGVRIDRYCDAANLTIEARVRLFLDVLAAVAFAHANLIVHRDLKPPNVLVGKGGEVKLLDFGIAKLLEPESKDGGVMTLTREGESALTPEYAAPEQLTGGPITTATDVYALGVVLYVLLTGQHPAGPNTTSPAELMKAVVESQPMRLSDAVSPGRLRHQLQGDLDNIVAKALKKQPAERYPSVEAMGDDLRRYLNHEPVSARADSIGYRAAKFVRRNRGGVAAAGLVLAALLAGTVGVLWQAREARIQRDAAQTQLARATAANEFTAFLLSVAAPAGRKFNVGELLEQGEILIDKQFSGDDALKSEMLSNVGEQYMQSEVWDKATAVLERAAEIAVRTKDPVLEARAWCPLALLKSINGDQPGADAMMQRAQAGLPDEPRYALARVDCLIDQSEFGFMTGDAKDMIARATAALAIMDQAPFATATKRISAQGSLAYGYYLAHQSRKADETYARLMTQLEAAGIDRTVAAVDILNNWGLVHFQGDIAKAEPLARRVVELRRSIEGAESVTPTDTYNYAGVLLQLGRYAEAEPLYEESIRTAVARDERRVQYDAMIELGGLYIERRELPRASAQLEKLTPFLKDPRFNSFRRAQLAYWRGRLSDARGENDSARAQFAEAVKIYDDNKEKVALNVQALIGLARAEQATGDGAGATAAVERALALAESFVEPGSPSYLVGQSLAARGDLELARGARDTARATFKAALAHLQETLGPDHKATRDAREKSSA